MNSLDLSATQWCKSSHSDNTGAQCVELGEAAWRESNHSTDTGGECVEVAGLAPVIAVRDSKDPGGPVLAFGRTAFAAFLETLRD